MKHSFLLIVLILGLQLTTAGQPKTDAVESFLRREMRERKIPGLQAAVVRNEKIVLLKSLGTGLLKLLLFFIAECEPIERSIS